MKVLITGGAGFIGSHLADACVERGYETYVADDLSTGQRENVSSQVRFFEVDIASPKMAEIIAEVRPDLIFHLAAQSSVPVSIRNPLHDARVNILGTINILEAARKAKVEKVIYASSAAVFGTPEYLPIDEHHATVPLSYYGVSKFVPEMYLRIYMDLYGLRFTALRYANVYGPRQIPHGEGGVVSIFVDRILKGEPLVIHGDGNQTRDFIYVSDVVAANLAAIERGDGGIYNIGTGSSTSINQLVETLEAVIRRPVEKQHAAFREGDIRNSYFQVEKAKDELQWQASVPLREGLERTLRSYGWSGTQ